MIVYIFVILLAGVGYVSLLSKYAILWSDISDTEALSEGKYLVSILIPFRNEEGNVHHLIRDLENLEIGNSDVQVVFVNDHSTDRGAEIVTSYQGKLDVECVLNTGVGKKAAIKRGWEACTGDIIIQTDADCRLSSTWLLAMLNPFQEDRISLACGPVKFSPASNFWQHIVSLDFAGLIAIGAAHIRWRMPMICNAANLAYRRPLIANVDLNESAASGDDIFLLQSAYHAHPGGIAFVKNKLAIVTTDGPSSFRAFWNQRLRWASKNGEYDIATNRWILIAVWLYNVLILTSLLSFSAIGCTAAAFLVILKVLAEDRFYSKFVDFFDISFWFTNILLGQPFHILYMALIPPLSQVLKYQWKERKQR